MTDNSNETNELPAESGNVECEAASETLSLTRDELEDIIREKSEAVEKAFLEQLRGAAIENACLKAGVLPEALEDAAFLADKYTYGETDIESAIKTVLGKYPFFAAATNDERPRKPVFGAANKKIAEEYYGLDHVRKLMGLKR